MKKLKSALEKIKGLWNIYGGIGFSTFVAWLTKWNKSEMDKWSSYLILMLTCISVLTFFKIVLFKKKASAIDKVASTDKSVKTLKTAVDPARSGEEIGNAILFTINGGRKFMVKFKNFLKEIWGNKFTITNTIIVLFFATLSQVVTYTDYLYRISWFAENELVVKIASPIIAGIWVFIDLFTTYTKYGFESLQELADRKMSKLSKEEKARLKNNLKKFKDSLAIAEKKYAELVKAVSDFEALVSAGYVVTAQENEAYNTNKRQVTNIESTIQNLKARIDEINKEL